MEIRKAYVWLMAAALPLAACGGGGGSEPAADPAAKTAASAAGQTGSSTVTGRVSFEGEAPEANTVRLSADPKCKALHPDGLSRAAATVSADGALKDVYVHVKGITGSFPAPADAALLDQNGCTYQPRMLAVMAGQPLTIKNSDDTLHNIHPRPKVNDEFNVGQPRQGMETSKTFDKPELMIPVGCDVHPWMRAYIMVSSHPFFGVTGDDGAFELKNLPAGEYEIEALHPKLGSATAKVTVADGESAAVELKFGAAAEEAAAEEGGADDGA